MSERSYPISYAKAIPRSVVYRVDSSGSLISAESSRKFQNSRALLFQEMLEGKKNHAELTTAFMAEDMVRLSLQTYVDRKGFTASLAPQSLEHGNGQKGVDLLLADDENLVHLGIDVKLHEGKSQFDRDGFGWNSGLKSPYIYLSLGNWRVNTREQENVSIRDWLTTYTIPIIREAGQIPKISSLREYLIQRIGRSIHGYQDALDRNLPEDDRIPDDPRDRDILRGKLHAMQKLFSQTDKNQAA